MLAMFALYLHYFALCLHCICTAALCVAPVVPFPLCTALAGLGWAGVSVLCHREGSFSPGATWRGQTRGHMPIHCTIC